MRVSDNDRFDRQAFTKKSQTDFDNFINALPFCQHSGKKNNFFFFDSKIISQCFYCSVDSGSVSLKFFEMQAGGNDDQEMSWNTCLMCEGGHRRAVGRYFPGYFK